MLPCSWLSIGFFLVLLEEWFDQEHDRECPNGNDAPQWVGLAAAGANEPGGGCWVELKKAVLQQKPATHESPMQSDAAPE